MIPSGAQSNAFAAEWPAPPNVRTLITTRRGGASSGPYASNNLAFHVGDDEDAVQSNRQRLLERGEGLHAIQWLKQVHGIAVLDAKGGAVLEADGSITSQAGIGCAVLTADCLPILLCDRGGRHVAAVHAGWRGLAAGILPAAIKRFPVSPADLLVYLGPAISQAHFEVGPEVRTQFLETELAVGLGSEYRAAVNSAFALSDVPTDAPTHDRRYRADLYGIARSQCLALGVNAVFGGEFCTYRDRDDFYSYRREGKTGRMASLIWLVT